jgi:hypothetical protein
MATNELQLERETCGRCGGSGHYSYCQTYGTTCFKCAGKKEVLTKRGSAALAYLKTLRSRKVSEVRVGDTVKMTGCTLGGSVYEFWARVESITPHVQEGSSLKDGVMVPYRIEELCLVGTSKGREMASYLPLDALVEVLLSPEEQEATLRQAVAYQVTLTKTGTPRKKLAHAGV